MERFDVNKFSNGIGKVIGEMGKVDSEALAKNIRASLDIAVAEINEDVNRGIQQMRAAHDNLRIYIGKLDYKADEIKNDFNNLKAGNNKFIQDKIVEVTTAFNDTKVEMISTTEELFGTVEKKVADLNVEAKDAIDSLANQIESRINELVEEAKIEIKKSYEGMIDEIIDKNIENHGDKIAEIFIKKVIPAFFRVIKKMFIRKKKNSA